MNRRHQDDQYDEAYSKDDVYRTETGQLECIEIATDALTSELEKSAPRWVSVEERLPEEDGSYFIYPEGKYYDHLVEFTVKGFTFDGDTIPPMSFYYVKDDSCGYTYSFKIEPEWWQPLPTPPAKKEAA